jgi:hypothetical protein
MVSKHLQVLRYRRLRNADFAMKHIDDVPGTTLALRQQFENAAPIRIAKDIERMHQPAPV